MVARIIEACAGNRGLVLLGVAIAAVASLYSIRHVQLDATPDLGDPQVIVFTEWMGRSPTLVEDQVTYPIVTSLLSAPKVVDVRGYSMFGMSFVYVIFEEGTDPGSIRGKVLELLSAARARLPEGVTPTVGPDASGLGWAFQYALVDESPRVAGGARHSLDELRTFQDFSLRFALGTVQGVAEVASVGGFQKQYQVTVDPTRLRAYDLTLDEVIAAIRDANNEVGGRVLELSGREYFIRGRGYFKDLGDLERTAIRSRGPDGAPVLVRDVGSVRFGPEIRRGLLDWNGEGEAVGGVVVVRQGENVLQVIDRVKKKIAELAPSFPPGVRLEIAYDRSDLIHRAIATLRTALVEEMIVVSLVIVIFLLHLRSALLPILSLPLAVALAFVPMWLFNIPATLMSLGGIAIAIGATVDAEIVMIEASHKKLERAPPGADRRKLLAEAAREVTPAIFFSLLVIAAAFLPVFTLTGQAGRMFRPLAFTKTFVMLSAAVLSITFAPAMRDLLIRGKMFPESRHPLSRLIIRVYKPFVFVALRAPRSTVLLGLLAVLSAVPLWWRLGTEFMPPLNEGDVLYMPTTFPNIAIEEARRQLQLQDRVLRGFPEVLSVFGKAGRAETATDPAPLTMVETTIRLRPQAEWRTVEQRRWYSSWSPSWLQTALRPLWPDRRLITWEELTTEMNKALQIPGWTNAFTMPIKARLDMLSTGVRTPVGVKVLGNSLEEIEKVGIALEGILTPVRGTRSVFYERNAGALYVDILPDREALARYGLSVGSVQRLIEAAVGGTPVGTAIEGRHRFGINVRYPQDVRSDVERLRRLLVPISGDAAGAGMGKSGALEPREPPGVLLAQMGMGSAAPRPLGAPPKAEVASDAPFLQPDTSFDARGRAGRGSRIAYVPLGQVAEVRVVSGPPMVREEGGLLAGYVFVDLDPAQRDLGGYVADAQRTVARAIEHGQLRLTPGTFLKWTGQFEQLEMTAERLRLVIPATLLLILILLYLHFRNFIEVLIVLLSIPFALVGSVWMLWLLDYRLSTAVWVGIIALVGLAAQTGIVMIVYIDHAYEARRAAGKIRDFNDIVWAHMEGTVLRVRPKLMTVATMLFGLVPLLWATGSGADVMKRIAAPMVGGLLTSAFLTLEIIPVIYTWWRLEQLLWERLAQLDPIRLARLRWLSWLQSAGWVCSGASLVAWFYWDGMPRSLLAACLAAASLAVLVGTGAYLAARPAARRLVWPGPAAGDLAAVR